MILPGKTVRDDDPTTKQVVFLVDNTAALVKTGAILPFNKDNLSRLLSPSSIHDKRLMQAVGEARAMLMEGLVNRCSFSPALLPPVSTVRATRSSSRGGLGALLAPAGAAAPSGTAPGGGGAGGGSRAASPAVGAERDGGEVDEKEVAASLLPQVLPSREDVQRRGARHLSKWLRQVAQAPERAYGKLQDQSCIRVLSAVRHNSRSCEVPRPIRLPANPNAPKPSAPAPLAAAAASGLRPVAGAAAALKKQRAAAQARMAEELRLQQQSRRHAAAARQRASAAGVGDAGSRSPFRSTKRQRKLQPWLQRAVGGAAGTAPDAGEQPPQPPAAGPTPPTRASSLPSPATPAGPRAARLGRRASHCGGFAAASRSLLGDRQRRALGASSIGLADVAMLDSEEDDRVDTSDGDAAPVAHSLGRVSRPGGAGAGCAAGAAAEQRRGWGGLWDWERPRRLQAVPLATAAAPAAGGAMEVDLQSSGSDSDDDGAGDLGEQRLPGGCGSGGYAQLAHQHACRDHQQQQQYRQQRKRPLADEDSDDDWEPPPPSPPHHATALAMPLRAAPADARRAARAAGACGGSGVQQGLHDPGSLGPCTVARAGTSGPRGRQSLAGSACASGVSLSGGDGYGSCGCSGGDGGCHRQVGVGQGVFDVCGCQQRRQPPWHDMGGWGAGDIAASCSPLLGAGYAGARAAAAASPVLLGGGWRPRGASAGGATRRLALSGGPEPPSHGACGAGAGVEDGALFGALGTLGIAVDNIAGAGPGSGAAGWEDSAADDVWLVDTTATAPRPAAPGGAPGAPRLGERAGAGAGPAAEAAAAERPASPDLHNDDVAQLLGGGAWGADGRAARLDRRPRAGASGVGGSGAAAGGQVSGSDDDDDDEEGCSGFQAASEERGAFRRASSSEADSHTGSATATATAEMDLLGGWELEVNRSAPGGPELMADLRAADTAAARGRSPAAAAAAAVRVRCAAGAAGGPVGAAGDGGAQPLVALHSICGGAAGGGAAGDVRAVRDQLAAALAELEAAQLEAAAQQRLAVEKDCQVHQVLRELWDIRQQVQALHLLHSQGAGGSPSFGNPHGGDGAAGAGAGDGGASSGAQGSEAGAGSPEQGRGAALLRGSPDASAAAAAAGADRQRELSHLRLHNRLLMRQASEARAGGIGIAGAVLRALLSSPRLTEREKARVGAEMRALLASAQAVGAPAPGAPLGRA